MLLMLWPAVSPCAVVVAAVTVFPTSLRPAGEATIAALDAGPTFTSLCDVWAMIPLPVAPTSDRPRLIVTSEPETLASSVAAPPPGSAYVTLVASPPVPDTRAHHVRRLLTPAGESVADDCLPTLGICDRAGMPAPVIELPTLRDCAFTLRLSTVATDTVPPVDAVSVAWTV